MNTKFENVDFWFEENGCFMVACKDRERRDCERWVMESLTEAEVSELYAFLKDRLEEA